MLNQHQTHHASEIAIRIHAIDKWMLHNGYQDTFLHAFWEGCKSGKQAMLSDFYILPSAPYRNKETLLQLIDSLQFALQNEPATPAQQRVLFDWYQKQNVDVHLVFALSYHDALQELKRKSEEEKGGKAYGILQQSANCLTC